MSFPELNFSSQRHTPGPDSPARLYILALALAAGGVVLQTRLPAGIGPHGVMPDLGLFVAVALGLIRGPEAGSLLGFVSAYLLTTRIPFSPGSYYISHVAPGYTSGLPRIYLFTDNPLVAPLAGLLAGLLSETLFFLLTPRSPALWIQSAFIQGIFGLFITPAIWVLLRSQAPPESL